MAKKGAASTEKKAGDSKKAGDNKKAGDSKKAGDKKGKQGNSTDAGEENQESKVRMAFWSVNTGSALTGGHYV